MEILNIMKIQLLVKILIFIINIYSILKIIYNNDDCYNKYIIVDHYECSIVYNDALLWLPYKWL